MANWLVYMHCSNKIDVKSGIKSLERMQSNLDEDVKVYLVYFGPNLHAHALFNLYTKNNILTLLTLPNNGIEEVVTNLKKISDYIIAKKIRIDAACIWSHGASYGLSPWKRWIKPFLGITDAVKYLIEPFGIKLVCFDSCYQGGISCLYQLPKSVIACIAPPAFHPFHSLMTVKPFGQLKKFITEDEVFMYAHEINCSWHDATKVKWKCLLVFDQSFIHPIAEILKQNFHLLKFDRKSQIDNEDANLHDLYAACRYLPQVQSLITKSLHASCTKCLNSCTKRVRGMSVEAHLPRKWLDAYTSTNWYKEIVRNKKGFTDDRLQRILNSKK